MRRRFITDPFFSLVDIHKEFRKITHPSTCPLPFKNTDSVCMKGAVERGGDHPLHRALDHAQAQRQRPPHQARQAAQPRGQKVLLRQTRKIVAIF